LGGKFILNLINLVLFDVVSAILQLTGSHVVGSKLKDKNKLKMEIIHQSSFGMVPEFLNRIFFDEKFH
jgi:hypothetical protein